MALFIFFMTFLISAVAFAYPNVGDKVQWTGSVSRADGNYVPVKIIKEVTAFDKNSAKWTVKYETTIGQETTTKMLEVDSLFSPDRYKEIIAHCEEQGGILEKVAAPAGTYETCKITTTTSEGISIERWWGNIPFGVVGKNTRSPQDTKNPQLDIESLLAGL